eukprot:TRINITY_DN5471_c0_g1_i1.p1 TRINITY_DN5471_c0_g1~~TRINITY_DN5471_c0_g1_i1.p1  ORF type:complete len:539 (-),score=114.10 TRINITY_DN5471_c0_g1_i1:150-1766(-)
MQYMCQSGDTSTLDPLTIMRDGTTTNTIPNNAAQAVQTDGNGNYVYGMHESYYYYQNCSTRERNKGLFTADQNVGNDATATRQNPNANRYGYECQEERDYYPYWAPSPWKDIVVFANSQANCALYVSQSQNVAPKGYCTVTPAQAGQAVPSTQAECLTKTGGVWNVAPAHGIPPPDCQQAPWSRDNHLGDGLAAGSTNGYNWTLPTADTEDCASSASGCNCVLRIRYNISNANIDGWGLQDGKFTDASDNNANSPITTDPIQLANGKNVSLAVNTAQYGRTFQDRSYIFKIIPRDNGLTADDKIYNLGVRGKRGNIVQTFPATEYDYVPKALTTNVGDYIHFQWTGCDTNPANNDGEGKAQTDRSNLVQVANANMNTPMTDADIAAGTTPMLFSDPQVRAQFTYIGQDETTCLNYDQLLAANGNNANNAEQDVRNCMKLNAAPTGFFNGGVVKMSQTGTYHFMNTRNNNFSNRTQKGSITVVDVPKTLPKYGVALIVIGAAIVGVAAAGAGGFVYAKKNPYSGIANVYRKMPGPLGRI